MYLTDASNDQALVGYNENIPVFDNLITNDNKKILYSGTFSNSETKYFRLRMWLSSNYQVNNDKKTFKIKINVVALN